jgi:hypothetical protein
MTPSSVRNVLMASFLISLLRSSVKLHRFGLSFRWLDGRSVERSSKRGAGALPAGLATSPSMKLQSATVSQVSGL